MTTDRHPAFALGQNTLAPVLLGQWFADPLAPDRLGALCAAAHHNQQRAHAGGGSGFGPRLQSLICSYWRGGQWQVVRDSLRATAVSPLEAALLELVTGQLLMSRKLSGAMERLDAGFGLAANLFPAGDYFRVLRRHALLRRLPLSAAGQPAAGLASLLTEARVIRALGPGPRRVAGADPEDTLG